MSECKRLTGKVHGRLSGARENKGLSGLEKEGKI